MKLFRKDVIFIVGIILTIMFTLGISFVSNAATVDTNVLTKPAALKSTGIYAHDGNGDGDYLDADTDIYIDAKDLYYLYNYVCK